MDLIKSIIYYIIYYRSNTGIEWLILLNDLLNIELTTCTNYTVEFTQLIWKDLKFI